MRQAEEKRDQQQLLPANNQQPPPLAIPTSLPSPHNHPTSAHVDEVHFAFLDGAPETPSNLRVSPSPSGTASTLPRLSRQRRYSHDRLQHLTGAGAPTSVFNLARILAFLILLGIIPSTIIFLVDLSVHNIFKAREELSVHNSGPVLGFFLYILTGLFLCLVSTFVCHIWSPDAEGSGIPHMKSLMSGFYDKVKPSLSLWTLLAKGVGLVCAIGGGLPVGWEGPNVHISCIVAHHLSRLPPFRPLRRDRAIRMQIMSCACAVGLASSFGTPIGGVLYALETTSSFYLVPTFWKCMFSTLAGSVVYDLLYKTPLVEAFSDTTFQNEDYNRTQLFAFVFLGVLLGVLGAFFVRCVHSVYILRRNRLPGTNRYVLLSVVGFIAAVVQYPLNLFRLDPRRAINEFFSADNMESLSSLDVALLVLIKFPLIVISIGLPVPAGVFIPCFLLGSGLGRLYGEFLRLLFGAEFVPGGYAVVGAAAFTAGVTRALSVAVVIFEVTGQLKHMVPTLAAVLISVIVANGINRSLYDTLIIMKELPYMPHMRRDRSPLQKVHQVMRTNVVALQEMTTLGDIRTTLDTYTGFDSFPVITPSGLFLGSVRRRTLLNLMNKRTIPGAISDPVSVVRSGSLRRPLADINDLEEKASLTENPENLQSNDTQDVTEKNDSSERVKSSAENHGDIGETGYAPAAETRHGIPSYGQNTETRLEPDLSPLVVTANTTLSQLHFMFVMLMPTHAYVLIGGVLRGIVTRGDIVQSGTNVDTVNDLEMRELPAS